MDLIIGHTELYRDMVRLIALYGPELVRAYHERVLADMQADDGDGVIPTLTSGRVA